MPNPKKSRSLCLVCGKETARAGYKYCSNTCQFIYQRRTYLEQWKKEEITGLNKMGLVSHIVKKYLREKFDNKCFFCGWSKLNVHTGVVPLVADHIDGNWRNNREDNLRLLCPNCDSLNPTFAGANKGKGRPNRKVSKRVLEAQSMVQATKI